MNKPAEPTIFMKEKKAKILDSWALLCYFEGQKGGEKVLELLTQATQTNQQLLISTVNWGEVLYTVEIRHGKEQRNTIEKTMGMMNLEIMDVDQNLTREAASFKSEFGLPYADCFAAALTSLNKGILITGDRDFKKIESQIEISWIQ